MRFKTYYEKLSSSYFAHEGDNVAEIYDSWSEKVYN